ncbi:MAG: biotin/lipoyl-binding protein, partial [Dehalococcoidia bacterium]|nr:biotin/lipoyl-binding protein [Dehalococcoidia bacterium]
MKALKIALAIVISVTSIFWASCTLIKPAAAEPKVQTANVQRGDLTIDITASGNLALAKTEDLAFELAGYVSEVLVKEGDQVKEGQVIAKLDTTDWDKQVKALDKKLTAVQRSLTTMEANLTKAQRQVSTKEFAVQQAELAVKTAEDNLKQITEVEAAQDEIDKAERDMKYAQTVLETSMKSASSGYDLLALQRTVINAKEQIAQAQKNLQDILKGISVKVTSNVALQVTTSQMQIEQGTRALEDAQIAVDDARTAVANARLDK